MAVGDIVSLPAVAAGISYTKAPVAWSTINGYSAVTASSSTNLALIGCTFQTPQIPGLDTTIELLIRVGVGAIGAEVVIAEMPYSFRMDTAVGYYLMAPHSIFLPEPVLITSGSRIGVMYTGSDAYGGTIEQIKLWFIETATSAFVPVDPIGMMGIFGI